MQVLHDGRQAARFFDSREKSKQLKGEYSMNQKITLKHLGPVEAFDMEIKNFNILIGEQAAGKSTIAKGIYFFRLIKAALVEYLCQVYDRSAYKGEDISQGFEETLKNELKSVFTALFGYSWDLDTRLYLRYEYSQEIWIDIQLTQDQKKYIDIQYSPKLKNSVLPLEQEAKQLASEKPVQGVSLSFASKERLRYYEYFKNSINEIFEDDRETYYIPAGRSMITLLSGNRSMIENENLDLITRRFLQIIDSIHMFFADGIRGVPQRYSDESHSFDPGETAQMLIRYLKGDYRYTPGVEYFIVEQGEHKGETIPINFTSSGQQEVLWLLNQLYILMLKKERAFVIIEEPEAHLYPSLQKEIVDFISFFVNINHSAVFVTTHSPYILTAANTLYFAGQVMEDQPGLQREIGAIIGRKREIHPGAFTAFKINPNKEVENLVNQTLGELSTELIDDISDEINENYLKIFDYAARLQPRERKETGDKNAE